MDLFQTICLQVCFANIWPEAVTIDEESSQSSCLLCQYRVQTPLLFAQQCPLHSVQWLAHYTRNRFYQLQSMCGVDDDLA